jgi:hypothetical protein
MYELTLCHLYPDLLNLYGDRGNIIALRRRAQWRGIRMHVVPVTLGDAFQAQNYNIVFLGGGQSYEQEIIQKDLISQKGNEIKEAIEAGRVFICICGGYQLMGKFYRTAEGRDVQFLDALNLWTVEGEDRMIGNLLFECDFLKDGGGDHRIIGFENHAGRTYLGKGITPLGKVIAGFGNNGEDGFEGARYKNVFCSYSHGSLLPKNPRLTDYLLLTALQEKYKDIETLSPLDDCLENKAHDTMIKRVSG